MDDGVDTTLLRAAAAGSALGYLADAVVARRASGQRVAAAARGLVLAAGVYPLARRRLALDAAEILTLLGAFGLAHASKRLPSRSARRLLGAAWIAHALFDATFSHHSDVTRLPKWYPGACAAYDVAFGLRLALLDSKSR